MKILRFAALALMGTPLFASDLVVAVGYNGNFTSGQIGAMYTLTVSNIVVGSTAGTVTVTDAIPATLTATAINGSGWTCTLATLTCTRSDVLAPAAGGGPIPAIPSYPPIVLTVNVNAPPGTWITNTATVSGGGDTNSTNNFGASTMIVAAPVPAASPAILILLAAGLVTAALRHLAQP